MELKTPQTAGKQLTVGTFQSGLGPYGPLW